MSPPSLNNLDKSTWQKWTFAEIAQSIGERVDPTTTDLKTYVGLEHIDAESIHIKRFGKREDVSGTKLRCYPGDIIFGRRRAYQRKAAICDFDGFCSAHSLVLRAKPDTIDPELFPFFLHSDQFMHRAVDISVGGLSPTINWTKLKTEEFLLPPKDQQAKLAELLWAADNALDTINVALTRLKTLHLSVIEKSLFKRNGNRTSATEIGTIVRGVGYKPEQLLESIDADSVVLLRSNNIQDGRLDFDDVQIVPRSIVKDEQILSANDFAVCMSNGSKKLVGKAARFEGASYDVCVGSFCSVFRPRTKDDSITAELLFRSETYRARIKQILTGSTINNLKPSDFDLIRFRIQKDQFQHKMAKSQCMKLLLHKTLLEKRSNTTKTLLKSLINQIF